MASQSSNNNQLPNGAIGPASNWGEFNRISFLVQQALAKMQTATLVRIESCTNSVVFRKLALWTLRHW